MLSTVTPTPRRCASDELQARQLGVSGVPFFVFDMALGVSGAQPTEMFASALQQAWERRG